MCESTILMKTNDGLEEQMKDVVKLEVVENNIICTDILGTKKEFKNARIERANLIEHQIILTKM